MHIQFLRNRKKFGATPPPAESHIRRYISARLKELWRDTLDVYLTNVLSQVQIDTGMSAGYLVPLAAAGGMSRKLIFEIKRQIRHSSRPSTAAKGSGWPDQEVGSIQKSYEKGVLFGKTSYQYKEPTWTNPLAYIDFDLSHGNSVFQYYLWEHGLQSQGGIGWDSKFKGNIHAKSFLENNQVKYINIPSILLAIRNGARL